jgi:hypothetical protein
MNCTTCRYELSQCLDGRLPSGRRTIVMQHATQCAECAAFWAELQAAQALTLRLQQPRVSADFRESLWQRIQAGEGTPDAVFREAVPMLAKVRYALTGAAAAAAVLLCALWLRPDRETELDAASRRATAVAEPSNSAAPVGRVRFHQDAPPLDDSPLLSSAQRLRFNLVARETARQLDQRYAAATAALQRLDAAPTEEALEGALANANDFHTFGELLLDMHDRKRLLFTDADVVPDLRFATAVLGQSRRAEPSVDTVRERIRRVVARDRLASVARTIAPVELDPGEEMDVLLRLNSQRPDIMPKLFYVLGNDGRPEDANLIPGATFFMVDDCGPSWVAPRSFVDSRLQSDTVRARIGGNGGTVKVQIVVEQPK